MRNMHNLVEYYVLLIGGSTSRPFQEIACPNLVCRYYMTQEITYPYLMVAMGIIITVATK